MEFLRKNLIILLLISGLIAKSQNNSSLQKAFSNSYELEAQEKYSEAIKTLQSVYSESSYELNMRLGWLYYLNNDHNSSIKYYSNSMRIMPVATEPLWLIISPLATLEKWNEVEKIYIRILKLDPKNALANYRLGLIYYYRKDYVRAKKYFDVSLNLFPFEYNYMLMSAWTNYFLGNKNDARVLFNKVLLYSPNNTSALEGLSLLK